MERVYGKGLTGMMKNGRVDPTTFGWDNRHTGGAQLGSSVNKLFGQALNRKITGGLTIDATTAAAYWMGFTVGMQYSGLARESL